MIVEWTEVKPEHFEAILALHKRQAEGIGCAMYLPDFTSSAVNAMACWRDGKLWGVLYFEASVEVGTISQDPGFVREAGRYRQVWADMLRRKGYQMVRALMHRNLGDKHVGMKAVGFSTTDDEYTHHMMIL